MRSNNRDSERPRFWSDYEAAMTLAGCAKRFHRNQTVISNLENIFQYLCLKFETLCNFQRSFHFFMNPSLVIDRSFLEVHVLPVSTPDSDGKPPHYERRTITAADDEVLKQYYKGVANSPAPNLMDLSATDLDSLLKIFGIKGDSHSKGIIIPFNHGPINMGCFVLWNQESPKRDTSHCKDDTLRGWVSAYYSFLQSLFTREYKVLPETYLPSYYAARWARAAILFADIRNFTPLTEVLRNAYGQAGAQDTSIFREIMDEHCREMARIIQNEGRGRIDKFLGDGIMAIFGEHEPDNPSKAVCRAVAAACRMVEKFNELKSGFLKKAFGGGYEFEYNETVEIELGVGIDYGTVLFEYLGDDQHREYTAVGDHVNFAQRLETQAARFDERTNTSNPHILISQTAERCIRPWLNYSEVKPVIISPKGKSQTYKVYGLNSKGFQRSLYDTSEESRNWISPWTSFEGGLPELLVSATRR
ncbi:MAG TPA: adenylate/guanylate cyclase domain-containing protein [Pyrinomonadaceae bacterium]|nr:adenylate/guanylate cyclase domain-containing protein [Pyrinomonadaceae bacterium]